MMMKAIPRHRVNRNCQGAQAINNNEANSPGREKSSAPGKGVRFISPYTHLKNELDCSR